jgi:pimeloyl-ACP methyl ester carboxylesterase
MEYDINGDRIYASNAGIEFSPEQETIIFLHGAGMDHTIWVLFSRFFARNGFNVLAIDLPGHGKSTGDVLVSIEQMADWLVGFLEISDISPATLIGHSMGSLIALETASRLADKISKLILLGTACPMQVGEPLLSAAKKNKHAAVDMIMLFGHAYSSQLGGNPVAGINIVNSSMRLLERSLDVSLYKDLNACNEYTNGLEAAAKISVPSTLILGDQDKMTPPPAALPLIETLSDSTLIKLHNCGHMMLSEQPEQVHQALVSALNRSA